MANELDLFSKAVEINSIYKSSFIYISIHTIDLYKYLCILVQK